MVMVALFANLEAKRIRNGSNSETKVQYNNRTMCTVYSVLTIPNLNSLWYHATNIIKVRKIDGNCVLNIEPHDKCWEIMKICEAHFEIIFDFECRFRHELKFKKLSNYYPSIVNPLSSGLFCVVHHMARGPVEMLDPHMKKTFEQWKTQSALGHLIGNIQVHIEIYREDNSNFEIVWP